MFHSMIDKTLHTSWHVQLVCMVKVHAKTLAHVLQSRGIKRPALMCEAPMMLSIMPMPMPASTSSSSVLTSLMPNFVWTDSNSIPPSVANSQGITRPVFGLRLPMQKWCTRSTRVWGMPCVRRFAGHAHAMNCIRINSCTTSCPSGSKPQRNPTSIPAVTMLVSWADSPGCSRGQVMFSKLKCRFKRRY